MVVAEGCQRSGDGNGWCGRALCRRGALAQVKKVYAESLCTACACAFTYIDNVNTFRDMKCPHALSVLVNVIKGLIPI